MEAENNSKKPIEFALSDEHRKALETISGKDRRVRLSGRVENGKFVADFVACNSAFVACNSAFAACNSPFQQS